MKLNKLKVSKFQKKILEFYKKNKRNLSWRKTKNPYFIHISEIMLAQTQVERVEKYYNIFIKKYPTLKSLAKAKKSELLKLWQGLGYNSRVLRLQVAAQQIIKEYEGKYPKNKKFLCTLSGVGPYTASAILSFAYNKEIGVVDTNIRRIFISEFNVSEKASQKELEEMASQLIPKGKSCMWNNALMDYGALVLTAKKTKIASKTKQSKFIGSRRWLRSQLLQCVLKEKRVSLKLLKMDFKDFNIEEVLNVMCKEEIFELKKGFVTIRN